MWLPSNATELGLVVAGIGFVTGLFGASVGFVSNFINTSRQIDRQERDRRREVYARFITNFANLVVEIRELRETGERVAELEFENATHVAASREVRREASEVLASRDDLQSAIVEYEEELAEALEGGDDLSATMLQGKIAHSSSQLTELLPPMVDLRDQLEDALGKSNRLNRIRDEIKAELGFRESKIAPMLEQSRYFEHELLLYGGPTVLSAGKAVGGSFTELLQISVSLAENDAKFNGADFEAAADAFGAQLSRFTELARKDTLTPIRLGSQRRVQ
jgi:hypothetical protein